MKAQPQAVEISLVKAVKPIEMEDLMTPNNVLTPANLDLVTPKEVKAPVVAQISLVAVMPAMVPAKSSPPKTTTKSNEKV